MFEDDSEETIWTETYCNIINEGDFEIEFSTKKFGFPVSIIFKRNVHQIYQIKTENEEDRDKFINDIKTKRIAAQSNYRGPHHTFPSYIINGNYLDIIVEDNDTLYQTSYYNVTRTKILDWMEYNKYSFTDNFYIFLFWY